MLTAVRSSNGIMLGRRNEELCRIERASAIGLPRSGLVALYDPYRDVYGRNVLPTAMTLWGGNTAVTAGQDDPFGGTTAYLLNDNNPSANVTISTLGQVSTSKTTVCASVLLKAGTAAKTLVGMTFYGGTQVGVVATITWGKTPTCALVPAGGHSTAGVSFVAEPGCEGWYRLTSGPIADNPASGNTQFAITFNPADWVSGGATTGTVYVCREQLNLGPTLHPYSAPVGGPGTLQTGTDYSGNGNTLTLGATTGASTDDPANTGTAWSFDGGDYCIVPAGVTNALKGATGLTLLVVAKRTVDTAHTGLIGHATTNLANRQFVLNAVSTGFYVFKDATTYTASGAYSMPKYSVVSVIGTWKASEFLRVYEGATLKNNVTTGVIDSLNAGSIAETRLGCYTSSNFLTGSEYLVAIYNRSFSPSEVTRTYAYLKGLMASRGVTLS